jgi:hypothetical protein
MSFLSTSCKIFHVSFLAMSKNRFLAMSFLAMYESVYGRAEWFLSWSQISKMAGYRSNDIGPNRNYPKFQDIWTTFDPAPKALKFEIFSSKDQFTCK